MVEIIPAIIGKNIKEISENILLVEPYVTWVQIDVSDGVFTPNVTWNNPEELSQLSKKISLEMHLMINNPEKQIDRWAESGAKRIIVHVSAGTIYTQAIYMSQIVKAKGVQFGIALSPDVPLEAVQNMVPLADVVLLLAVPPGFSGQEFNPSILEKIRGLRKLFPNVIIEIDGGVIPLVAKQCVEAGANILVSGSYIFESKNIGKAIEELKS